MSLPGLAIACVAMTFAAPGVASEPWYLSRETGSKLANGTPDRECVPAETTPAEVIARLGAEGRVFTRMDGPVDAHGDPLTVTVSVPADRAIFGFWRSKEQCDLNVAKRRRDASTPE